ncbi:hypothetical protein QQ045_022109 [Rhodiola kirilowii]
MEGLIPMILKKMKRNNIRRNYQCLSQSPRYDFYANNSSDVPLPPPSRSILDNSNESAAFYDGRHRRRISMPEEFMKAEKGGAELELDSCPPPMGSKQFVQFRSQRMFG